MKKLIYLIVVITVLGLIVSGCIPVVPSSEQDELGNLEIASVSKNGGITIDGVLSTGEWDAYYLGTSVTSWSGGMSVDVYGHADDTYLYAAYVANMNVPGWSTAAGLCISANLDYMTPQSASWPDPGYTHISVYGDGFAQTNGSGWNWPDGWGNTNPSVFTSRGIEYYVGEPCYGSLYPNTAEIKIPLSLLTYAGNDGKIALGGQYWQYDWAEPFYVDIPLPDEEGPVTLNVAANPNPVPVGDTINLTATIDDTNTGGSNIASAEYSLDGGGDWLFMDAADTLFDSPVEAVTATIGPFDESQVVEILVRGTDTAGNVGEPGYVLLAVYDPTAGFVTGGGWIDSPEGAYAANPSLTGKATFGFVSKYKKGAIVPTGNTEFQFKAGDLNFHSDSYDWLVIAGDKAMYKGIGTINGTGDYGFMLSATDDDPDLFRIKIQDKDNDIVIYDNNEETELGGGQIIVHKAKQTNKKTRRFSRNRGRFSVSF